jgi:hypothetical protein
MFKIEPTNKMIGDFLNSIENGNILSLMTILNQGLDINFNYSPELPFHETFLSYAIDRKKKEVADFLLSQGALPNSLSVESSLDQGDWDFTRKQIEHSTVLFLDPGKIFSPHVPPVESNKIIKTIIDCGFPLDQISSTSVPLIHYPLKQNNLSSLRYMIENGLSLIPMINIWEHLHKFSEDLNYFHSKNQELFRDIDPSINTYIHNLINNPSLQYNLMKASLTETLDNFSKNIQKNNTSQEEHPIILEIIQDLKNIVNDLKIPFSPFALKNTLWHVKKLLRFKNEIPLIEIQLETLYKQLKNITKNPIDILSYEPIKLQPLPSAPSFFSVDKLQEFVKVSFKTIEQFHLAVKHGNLKEVQKLINEGVDINLNYQNKFPYAKTFLQIAIEEGQLKVVEFLLKKGALPNSLAIETSLNQRDWTMAQKLIDHAHFIQLNPRKIFMQSIPLDATNKILDKIIQKGCDLNISLKDSKHPLLKLVLWQRNGEAIQKLILNGIDLSYPHANTQKQRRVLENIQNHQLDSSTTLFVQDLIQDLDRRKIYMKNNIIDLLDKITNLPEIDCLESKSFKKIIQEKNALKNEFEREFENLSFTDVKKIQIRINHILNHPVNKFPLLIAKILDHSRIKESNQSHTLNPIQKGFPPNIAHCIERNLESINNQGILDLPPVFQKVENLNLAVAEGRQKKALLFDYELLGVNGNLRRNL